MKPKCAPEVSLSLRSKMGPCSGDIMVSKNNKPTAKGDIYKNLYRCERHANHILSINPYRPFGGKIKFKVAKISKNHKATVKSKPEAKKGGPKKVEIKVKKKRGRPKKAEADNNSIINIVTKEVNNENRKTVRRISKRNNKTKR